MRRFGGGLFVERPFPRILDAQAGSDDQEFVRRVFLLRLQQHPAQGRVDRQPGEFVTELGQFTLFVERTEFVQQIVARRYRCGRRRLD